MKPTHHASEQLLQAYVVGSSGQAVDLAVACHVARCALCQERVAELEAVGGALLGALDPTPLSPHALDAAIERLVRDEPPPDPPRGPVPAHLAALDLPGPLAEIAAGLGAWKTFWPGFRRIDLPLDYEGERVALIAMDGGAEVPEHGHEGLELNVVLAGGFDDLGEGAAYLPGDLSLKERSDVHGVRVHEGEACVVLVVRGGRMVPKDLKGRLGAWITGM